MMYGKKASGKMMSTPSKMMEKPMAKTAAKKMMAKKMMPKKK